jgi:hypothetical protein
MNEDSTKDLEPTPKGFGESKKDIRIETENKLNELGYEVLDIEEFMTEQFQNLRSVAWNIKHFKEYFGDYYTGKISKVALQNELENFMIWYEHDDSARQKMSEAIETYIKEGCYK